MSQLNEAQQRVVTTLDKNILLLASAGTGKTNTLAHRVAHILQSGAAKGDEILCMTFTNKACREMKDRILTMAGSVAKAVEVSTFHSFCYKVLQEESKRNDTLYMDMSIYDEVDCQELLAPWLPIGMREPVFMNLISHVKEYRSLWGMYTDTPADDYRHTIDRLFLEQRDTMERFFNGLTMSTLADFRETGYKTLVGYEEALANVHGVDFTDLITQVHRLFQEEPIRERWRSRYSYISVDEMQDTSDLEAEVMKLLWQGNHILLCGDYFQTIYEWRGSNPERLLAEYKQEFQPEVIVFYENYRANRQLFDASFAVLKRMFPRLINEFYEKPPFAATKEEGEPIIVHKAPTEWKEGAYIFDMIQTLPKEANIGVLVRSNKQAQYLSALFSRCNDNLPPAEQRQFMIIDEYKFFRRQEIKDVMAYFKLLLNPHDALSAKRLIKRYVKGIGEARIQQIESETVRTMGLRLTDFLDMQIFESEPYDGLIKGLAAGNIIVYDVESTGTDTTKDEIIQIAAFKLKPDGSEGAVFERFIRPSKPVGDSELVHGFSDAYLADHGEDAATVLVEFKEFTKGAIIVGHNVNYDISIFTSELHRHNLGDPQFAGVYDTLDIYRRFYPRLANHKLGFLSETFPINYTPTHNAMDDIRATARLLLYAIEKNIEPTADQRRALISNFKNAFATMASQMATLRRKIVTDKPSALLAYIMKDMGVLAYYTERREHERVEYIRDLYRLMVELEGQDSHLAGREYLQRMLEQAALTAGEPDQRLKNNDRIPIITVHQAKGSEFDYVFLAGLRDGVFPSFLALKEGKRSEEQRLFYVAITRAKQRLFISYASTNDRGKPCKASEFLQYLPNSVVWE